MTENHSTPSTEQSPTDPDQPTTIDLIDIRDEVRVLSDANDFFGEAVFELFKSDEAEPNTHGLSIILDELRSREQRLLDGIDALLKRRRSARAEADDGTPDEE